MIIPPFCDFTLRATGEFFIKSPDGAILGPDDSSKRVYRIRTGYEPMEIEVVHNDTVETSYQVKVRPDPREENNGIPAEMAVTVPEPTIQDMIKLYIQQETQAEDADEIETPDEFFDMDMDDDEGHLLTSQYEYTDMIEEYPIPQDERPEPEQQPEPQTQENSQATPPNTSE